MLEFLVSLQGLASDAAGGTQTHMTLGNRQIGNPVRMPVPHLVSCSPYSCSGDHDQEEHQGAYATVAAGSS